MASVRCVRCVTPCVGGGGGEGGIASEALDFRTNEVPYLTSTFCPLPRIRQISQSAVTFLSIKRAGFVART